MLDIKIDINLFQSINIPIEVSELLSTVEPI